MVCVMKDIPVWSSFFFCCQASLRRECAWSEFVLLSATIVLVASRQVQTSGQRRDDDLGLTKGGNDCLSD